MYYVIEYNTDMRYPQEKIHKFKTEQAARNFVARFEMRHAFANQADSSLPVYQQNWHKRIVSGVYKAPKNWRLANAAKAYKKRHGSNMSGSMYCPRGDGWKARVIYKECEEIREFDPLKPLER